MKAKIYPSIIGADHLNLQKEIKRLEPYSAGFHIDVMDNHFVPNLTSGTPLIDALSRGVAKQLWVHLMVDDVRPWLEKLFLPAGSIVSFHIESKGGALEPIKIIKEKKWLPSIAINPKTPLQDIFPFVNQVYQVLIMSVEPGFAGQEFIKSSIDKINTLNGYRQTANLQFRIGIDGGINKTNIKEVHQHGVEDFAIASGIFKEPDPVQTLQEMDKMIDATY